MEAQTLEPVARSVIEHPVPSTFDAPLNPTEDPVGEILKSARTRYKKGASEQFYYFYNSNCAIGAVLTGDPGLAAISPSGNDWGSKTYEHYEEHAVATTREAIAILNTVAEELYGEFEENWPFGPIEALNQEGCYGSFEERQVKVLRCYDVAIARRAELVA